MILANLIAFAILKILQNLVSMQKYLFAFTFIELSETPNSLVKILLVLEIKNVAGC